jgi:hypothetical protein
LTILIALVAALAFVPLAAGLWLLPQAPGGKSMQWRGFGASALLCALAFNLTFFVQEVGLVIPKALVPGLHPVLYHNDHDWRGDAPIAELLQATGAVATLASGLVFLWLAQRIAPDRPGWRLFAFWMAFEGLFQSLSQWAVGSLIPGNDVGRALAWLGAGVGIRIALLAGTAISLFAAGRALAPLWPLRRGSASRATVLPVAAALAVAVLLCIPFRAPREPVEVVLIPIVVHLIGLGWLALGFAMRRAGTESHALALPGPPLAALALLLAFFQIVLRPGIAF